MTFSKIRSTMQTAVLFVSCLALLGAGSVSAAPKRKTIKRSAIAQYEGEYEVEGSRVRKVTKKGTSPKKSKAHAARGSKAKKSSARVAQKRSSPNGRRPASIGHSNKKTGKKPGKVGRRYPASEYSAKSAKRGSKNAKKKLGSRDKKKTSRVGRRSSRRLPYARETSNERDMPFISVPTSRVRRKDTQLTMEDPMQTPSTAEQAAPAHVNPQPEVNLATQPDTTPPMEAPIAPPTAERAPASAEVYGPRAPDAFDLHSGTDPMSPGSIPPAPPSEQ